MTKQETYDYLDSKGIKYEIQNHKAVFTMAESKLVEHPHPEADAKNLFLRDDKKHRYYMITVKGEKKVDLNEFRKDNGTRRLSFASPEDMFEILRLTPGSVTPLGLLEDSELKVIYYLDSELAGGLVAVHPNDNTATVFMQSSDLISLIQAHGNQTGIIKL